MTQVRERPGGSPRPGGEHDLQSKIGVIGAGQMGNGIAHVCALAGYGRAAQRHLDATASMPALATINGNLTRQVSRKLIKEADMDAR